MQSLAAALLLSGTACAASPQQAPQLTNEKFEVRAGESPLQVAVRLAEQLRPQLAKEVSGSGTIAFGHDQIGLQGERLIVAAVSPTRGAFALIPLDGLQSASSTVPVCRFELAWPDARAELSAGGLQWALRSLPDTECRTVELGSADWERKSAAVARTVTAQRAGTTIVSVQDKVELPFPPDLRAALQTALRPGERLERVAPLPRFYDPRAVGWTSSGRVLLAVPDDNPFDVCVVEAADWSDLVSPASATAQELVRRCDPLLAEVRAAWMKRMEQSLKKHPITSKPVR